MKGKIKALSLLMAVAMSASMFVACADKPAADTSSTGGTDASKTESKKDDAPAADPATQELVKLKWYHWGNQPNKPDDVIKALNEQSKKDINTEIDFVWATDNDENLKMVMSTGGEYDIAFTCNWFANYALSAQEGYLADITEKVKTVTPKLYEYIPELVWEGSKVQGKIYAVPTYKDTAAQQYWMVNKPYVIDGAKAEAELKATGERLSTVTPLLEKVKAYADAGNPYPNDLSAPLNFNKAGLNGHDRPFDAILSTVRLGVKIAANDNKVISFYEDADYVSDLKTLKDWHDRGLTNKNALEVDTEYQYLCVGTAQGWEGAELNSWEPKFQTPVAINKRDEPLFTTGAIQGSMNGISIASKNVDRALQYLEYVNTDKTYRNMLAYGIEGVNWKLDAEGRAEKLTGKDWETGAFASASFFELIPTAPAPADMWSNLKAVSDAAEATALVGFVPITDEVSNEIAACTDVIKAVENYIQTGSVDDVDAKIKETMDKLNANGYEKIKTEMQKQVDAFIAAK